MENVPIVLIVLSLVVLYVRGVRFSPLAYILMSILPYWHTIGGHYTFERVPFDWFSRAFGFKRNMYDRIGHFSVGFDGHVGRSCVPAAVSRAAQASPSAVGLIAFSSSLTNGCNAS